MDRRQFVAAALAGRSPIEYHDYSRCLPEYLKALAQQAYDRRKRELDRTVTAEQVEKRRAWARSTFWRLIGGPLEKTPLNARVVSSFERERYRVENLIYESRPGLHITANLYLPKVGKPPYPGVLFQMGHSLNGKASTFYQFCCQGLAQLGFVVLAFDPMGQGERTYYPRPGGTLTRLPSADDEHTMPGRQLLLVGDTSTRFQVWDAVRSLDYLAAHPMVDPARLASTGNSGGGTLTMFLAAVDDRLACAAVASGNTENHACANFNSPGSTDDAEQNFVNGALAGFDRWDTLHPFVPKPLLVLVSAKDHFGTYSPRYMENGRQEFAALQRLYGVMGKPEHVSWYETPLPHGISYDLRMEVYRWFRRWLQGNLTALREEPPVKAEPDERLWCTKTGNVVRDLAGLTPQKIALEGARRISTPSQQPNWDRLLGLNPTPPSIPLSVRGTTESRLVNIEAIEVTSTPGVWLPAWVYRPKSAMPGARWVIVVEPGGRNGRWNEEGLYQKVAAAGSTVVAADVRGIGDLNPEFPRQSARHAVWHQNEEAYAWASLMLGRPLLGQRVTDLRALIRAAASPKVTLVATGKMTIPALIAAALEPKVEMVHLGDHLASFRLLIEPEEYTHTLASFVFDVLRHTDLPQVAGALAPRKVRIAGLVDASGRPLDAAKAGQWYSTLSNVEVAAPGSWMSAIERG